MIDVIELGATAADGRVIRSRLFRGTSPKRLVLMASALAVPQRFYRRFATYLAKEGAAVLTLDYRGIGDSRMRRMVDDPARAQDWVLDLDAALRAGRQEHADLPLSVLGHSFGGQVLPLMAKAHEVEHAVTIGSQFVRMNGWSGLKRVQMAATFHALIPAFTSAYGYLPGWTGIGENVPKGVARDWARWCRSRRYLLDHVPGAVQRFADFDAHVQVIAVEDDAMAPVPSVRAFADELPNASVEVVRAVDLGLRKLGHFGPFRKGSEAMWPDLAGRLFGGVPVAAA